MNLPAAIITDAQIRALRDRYGEGTRMWDPAIVLECDLALGDATAFDTNDRDQRALLARKRCAEINARATATRKKSITLPEFLTKAQIALAAKLYEEYGFVAAKAQIQTNVIEPNMTAINAKLGQENDASYLAYAVVYVLSEEDE